MAAATWNFDGHPRRFREILSRRKKKKGVCMCVWGGVDVYVWL
jgi:hypothetical protein